MARPPLPIGSWGRIARQQLGPRQWVARARYRDDDGATRKVEARGKSGAEAERNLIAALGRRGSARADEITAETRMSALVDYWLRTEIDDSDRATNTRQRYREVAELHVVPGVGGLLVRESTTPRLDTFVRRVAADVGVPTAKLAKTVLSGALAVAVRHGAVSVNPMREVATPRQVRSEVRALSMAEVGQLRADLATDPAAASVDLPQLVAVLLGTGARLGEALALRWSEVEVDAVSGSGTLALTGTVVRIKPSEGGPGRLVRQDTTKGHRPRRLQLPPFAVAVIAGQYARGLDGGAHHLVFPSSTGGLREVHTVEKQWRAFRERHPQWAWVRLHVFRKTVATHVDRQRGTAMAAAQLGHTSERITTDHYVERSPLGPDLTDVLEQFEVVSAEFSVGTPADQVPAVDLRAADQPERGGECRRWGSNPRPRDYESPALTG